MNVENREISQKLIDSIDELRKSINTISVYDFNIYSSMELYYTIANKLNELIKECYRYEVAVSEEVVKQNECLQYLLNEGLMTEVVNKINIMVKDGTMDSIINQRLLSRINTDLEGKASKQELQVERNRIDSIISLPSGSTTGDAELIDGRIGSNGKTYDTIGNSIRGQIDFLINNLNEGNILRNISISNSVDNTFINTSNNTSTHNSYAISQTIQLLKNETIVVTCAGYNQNVSIISKVNGSSYQSLVASKDSNENIYSYTASSNMNVVVSFNKTKMKTCFVCRNTEIDLDYIYNQLDILNIRGSNIYSTSQDSKFYDMNTLPKNKIITYSIDFSNVANTPHEVQNTKGSVLSLTGLSDSSTGCTFQLIFTTDNVYYRMQYANVWFNWNKLIDKNKDADIYPNLSMFPKFAVIGDSYASGQVYNDSGNDVTRYDLSWGQNLARQCGTTCLNLSRGGLSTRTWLTDSKGLSLLNSSDPQDIYYLCLGINDYSKLGESYLGSTSDIGTSNDTFYGNYSKIVTAIKSKAPKSKIIMFTVANTNTVPTKFSNAIKDIANYYNVPCVTLTDDPLFTSSYYTDTMVQGHPTASIYSAMSKAYKRLIEKCIHDNFNYFKDYGF